MVVFQQRMKSAIRTEEACSKSRWVLSLSRRSATSMATANNNNISSSSSSSSTTGQTCWRSLETAAEMATVELTSHPDGFLPSAWVAHHKNTTVTACPSHLYGSKVTEVFVHIATFVLLTHSLSLFHSLISHCRRLHKPKYNNAKDCEELWGTLRRSNFRCLKTEVWKPQTGKISLVFAKVNNFPPLPTRCVRVSVLWMKHVDCTLVDKINVHPSYLRTLSRIIICSPKPRLSEGIADTRSLFPS